MNNILFITEGPVDEKDFLEKMYEIFYPGKDYNIYPYETKIHTLTASLFQEDKLDENLDIRLTLKALEKDEKKKAILSQKYTDIFLVFDLDPHDKQADFEKIKKLVEYFDDSSDKGKLYINYPMMQSYKHLQKMPDDKFKDRKIEIESLTKYKEIVARESSYIQLKRYNYPIFMSIIAHHIKKANFILNSRYNVPTSEEFIKWNYAKIYDEQISLIEKKREVYILNTFIFHMIEYKPKELLGQLISKKDKFLI